MSEENDKYYILEIGPADQPRHDLGEFKLGQNERYLAVDIEPAVFQFPIWKRLKAEFKDKITTAIGSRDSIPAKNNSFDEIIMLGSQGNADTNMLEIERILKQGGTLKLGCLTWGIEYILKEWEPELTKREYKLVNRQEYDLKFNRGSKDPQKYTVLTFKKE